MILALDVGNTNIVIGCIENQDIYFESRISTDTEKTDTEYAVIFKNLLDIYDVDLSHIDGAIISSVVPQITNSLKSAIFTVTGSEPVEIDYRSNHGLKIDPKYPEEVGNDLIVGAVAALREHKAPLIIFDFGTATTISVIDDENSFRGVSILPGIKTSMNALFKNAAQLSAIRLEAPESVIGTNTVEAVQSGIVFGNVCMVDGMIERIEKELGKKATIVATGGLANVILKYSKHDIIYDDSMLLKGLWYLYEMNK